LSGLAGLNKNATGGRAVITAGDSFAKDKLETWLNTLGCPWNMDRHTIAVATTAV
jgi:hypothetical protein